MSVVTLTTAPRTARRTRRLQNFFRGISNAVDALVQSRVQQAVPEGEMHRCQDEIHRYRRLMHTAGTLPNSRAASLT